MCHLNRFQLNLYDTVYRLAIERFKEQTETDLNRLFGKYSFIHKLYRK